MTKPFWRFVVPHHPLISEQQFSICVLLKINQISKVYLHFMQKTCCQKFLETIQTVVRINTSAMIYVYSSNK